MKTTYSLDPAHTSAQFSVRHMMISNVRGAFGKVTGSLVYDPDDPAASHVEAAIDVASINTNEPQRDNHLRSADFFDVAHFPAITFTSRIVEHPEEDEWKVSGDLTIRGVTRPVVLRVESLTPEVKDPFGNLRMGLSASTKIKRSDFGLTYNAALETGGVLIGDDVKIVIDVSAIRQATSTVSPA